MPFVFRPVLGSLALCALLSGCGGPEPTAAPPGTPTAPPPVAPVDAPASATPVTGEGALPSAPGQAKGIPTLPLTRVDRAVRPGMTLALPEGWRLTTPPKGAPPQGITLTAWSGADTKRDGPGALVVQSWTAKEFSSPKGTIVASYKGTPAQKPAETLTPTGDPVCEGKDKAYVCRVSLVSPEDQRGCHRIIITRDLDMVQMDLWAPPQLGASMLPQLEEIGKSLKF